MKRAECNAVRDLKIMFFNQLDAIYKACEITAKEFGKDEIPLKYLKHCIRITKRGYNKGLKKS